RCGGWPARRRRGARPGARCGPGAGRAGVPAGWAARPAAWARGWPCVARLPLDALRGAGDEGEELVPVRGELRRADARAGRQLALGPGPALGDAPQVTVVVHDVGRHAAAAAELAACRRDGGLVARGP